MIKQKRRRQRRIKKILTAFLIFAIAVLAAWFIVVKIFVVKTVKVEGNKLYDEQLIKETVLNDEYSWNSLYVLLKYTFTDTQEVPFIDTMEIKLNSPGSLTIKVYEKGMLGYLHIKSINQMAYFDKDGFVVETSTRLIENVPKVEGIPCDEVVLFEKLPIDDGKLRDMLTLTQTLKREKLVPDSIDFGKDASPVLYYDKTAVNLGSIELLTQKVERLREIFPSIEGTEGVLHLENWTEETANIIFEKEVSEQDTGEDTQDTGEGTQDADEGTQDTGEGTDEDTQDTDEDTKEDSSDSDEMTSDDEETVQNEDETDKNEEEGVSN